MAAFETKIKVRFAHTDPAGIVFFPRYFEMLNQAVEDWFELGLGLPHRKLVMEQGHGVPAAHIETDFRAVSRLGDDLTFSIEVEKLGRSSCTLRVVASMEDEVRVAFRHVIVFTSLSTHKSVPWPDDLRARMAAFVVDGVQDKS